MEKTIIDRRIDPNTDSKLAIPVDHECGIPKNAEFKVTAEAANQRTIQVRISTINYQNIADKSVKLDVYLSRSRNGVPITASAPNVTVPVGTQGKVWETVGGQPVYFQVTPTKRGMFSINIETPEAETFYLVVVLPDGTLACSNAVSFVDADAPVVEILTPADSDPVNGTQALTYGVTGVHVAEEARIGSAAWAPVVSGALINTLSGWGAAPQGAMLIQVRAVDGSGNIGMDSVSVIKDTVAPVVAITAPLDGVKVKGDALFTFTNDDPLATVEARIGTAAWAAVTSGDAMSTLSGWGAAGEGAIDLQLRATDAAGNVGSNSKAPVKDTVPPVLTVTFPTDPSSTDGTDLLQFSTDETAVVEAKIGAGAWAEVTTGVTVVSAVDGYAAVAEDDTFTMNFRATDEAGNQSTLDVANITKNETP